MAGRLLGAWSRALDANGAPINGAKATFTRSGTGNLQNTYTTAALSVAHTNPVESDAEGWFPEIWADVGMIFRVEVTDENDVTIYGPEDNIVPLGAGSAVAPAAYTTDTTLTLGDLGRRISGTGTWTLTLPVAAGLPLGWSVRVVNEGTGQITLATTGGDTIDLGLSRVVGPGEIIDLTLSTATNFKSDNVSSPVGRHALWVPVDAMIVRLTNGPGASVTETTTNKVMMRTLDFDAGTPEYAQWRMVMPKSWNEGTITFKPRWTHGSTTTNFKVSWGLQAVAISDDDASDAAFGTAQYSNDTGGTTGDIYAGPESAAITIAGTPQAEDVVVFQVLRKADDATNDTLAVDALLLGITIYLTTDVPTDFA